MHCRTVIDLAPINLNNVLLRLGGVFILPPQPPLLPLSHSSACSDRYRIARLLPNQAVIRPCPGKRAHTPTRVRAKEKQREVPKCSVSCAAKVVVGSCLFIRSIHSRYVCNIYLARLISSTSHSASCVFFFFRFLFLLLFPSYFTLLIKIVQF